jgi:predicted nicotinamide N-methyase
VSDSGLSDADVVRANTRPQPVPLVPEITLWRSDEDPFAVWERTGPDVPYWAFPWAGGQALARHLLDRPALVAGRSVLDLASGSGLVAIAAALAGAGQVTAVDVDPLAVAAIGLNATANGVTVTALRADLLDSPGPVVDVLLAGDVCYDVGLTARILPFISRAAAAGATVLLGDPGRDYFPRTGFRRVAGYAVPGTARLESRDVTPATVWTPA